MILIIIFAILLAIGFFLSSYPSYSCFSSFCFGFLGLLLGTLIGVFICTLICTAIYNDPAYLADTKTYPLAQINVSNESVVLASNYVLDESKSSDFIVYMIKDDTITRFRIHPKHIHFVTTDTAQAIRNNYHFKTKICRLLFEYTNIYSYECYVPMQPLTSS